MPLYGVNSHPLNEYRKKILAEAKELRENGYAIGVDSCPLADVLESVASYIQYSQDIHRGYIVMLSLDKLKKEYKKLRCYRFSMLPDQSPELKAAVRLKAIIDELEELRNNRYSV